jgi:hypothetical protein
MTPTGSIPDEPSALRAQMRELVERSPQEARVRL